VKLSGLLLLLLPSVCTVVAFFYLSLLRCINAFRRWGIRVGSVLACVVRSSVCEGRR
jgi:hypothetical protein